VNASGGWAVLRRLAGHVLPHRRKARFIRRTHIRCPQTGALVEIELEFGSGLPERRVLRCSAHPEQPPPCDQRCRFGPDAFVGPADALIILPEGCESTKEQD
jgi:hypothetical protein